MAKNRKQAAAPGQAQVQFANDLMAGRWATSQYAKARSQGKGVTAATFRTADTLRHEEWKTFDQVVLEETRIRLVGVADLIADGFVKPVANALGKMVFGYEKVSDMDAAQTSLDGLAQTTNDIQEFNLSQIPLPITHKDFFLNLRQLEASRNEGESIDTLQARTAARKVAERLEYMLFNGGPTYGGMPTYGYLTEPNVNTQSYDSGKDWADATKTGPSYLADVLAAITKLQADGYYGPYRAYVPTGADVLLDNDYNAGTANIQTIRGRLLQVSSLRSIAVADQIQGAKVVVAQASEDVAAWVSGLDSTPVQWDEAGGFKVNFKVFAIGTPLIRSTLSGKSGICILQDA